MIVHLMLTPKGLCESKCVSMWRVDSVSGLCRLRVFTEDICEICPNIGQYGVDHLDAKLNNILEAPAIQDSLI